MSQVTTSLVVNFSDSSGDSSGFLSAEIDSRETGYNGGRTSFIPGDTPVFLVFKSSDVSIESVASTSGSCTLLGTGSYSVTDMLTFAGSTEASLSKPPLGSPTLTVLSGSAPGLKSSGSKVVCSSKALAVVKAVYTTQFTAYKLSGVPLTLGGSSTFPVVVLITGSN